MAITNAQIAALPTYTDAEMVIMLRAAIMGVTINKSYTMPTGENVTREGIQQLRETLEYFEERVNAAANTDTGGGIALVQFGERY